MQRLCFIANKAGSYLLLGLILLQLRLVTLNNKRFLVANELVLSLRKEVTDILYLLFELLMLFCQVLIYKIRRRLNRMLARLS